MSHQYQAITPNDPLNQYPSTQYMAVQLNNGLQKLAGSQGIFIKQKFEVLEAITGYETPNVYKVYPGDANGQKISDHTLFKCKEKSNWCARQCLSGDCRPFTMKVSNEQGQIKDGEFDKTLFLTFERLFKCTCCCWERPEMTITLVENGENRYFGKITNPCLCCSLGSNIEDANGNLKYVITGTCCQASYLCMCCPCDACQEFTFLVQNPTGEVVTKLEKKSAGCLKSCFGDADNFALGFPPGASPEDKVLLMAAALFLDFMYFENKQDTKPSTTGNNI